MLIDRRAVGWTMKTSVPRMFSSIWNETSVSGKRRRRALSERHAQKLADVLCEIRVRTPREHFQIAVTVGRINRSIKAERGGTLRFVTIDFQARVTHLGWGGRIRTFEYGFQRPAPYRLATPQYPARPPRASRNTLAYTSPPGRGKHGRSCRL